MKQNSDSYTMKEVVNKLEKKIDSNHLELTTTLNAIVVQTTKTNGRVTAIEESRKNENNTHATELKNVCDRIATLESDNKKFTWKIAGLSGAIGVISTLLTMFLGKLM